MIRRAAACAIAALAAAVAACSSPPHAKTRAPSEVRAEIARLMPARVADRAGWAADIQAALAAQRIEPSTGNLCAVLAIAEQESSFVADPPVPGVGKVAIAELERRAAEHHVPALLVRAALTIRSPNGQSYEDRIAAARTEQDLSRIYEDFIASVPLGRRLLASGNPVRTGGPMQVSIDFAQRHARDYPYPVAGSIRDEVFTRRGGLYFGVAHLLGYPAPYDRPLYRFADYNAGFYASRNAAFQQAVTVASGVPLVLDGDLVRHEGLLHRGRASATEIAVRALGADLELDDARIHRALEHGDRADFDDTTLYKRVFALAERRAGRPLPRATLPKIALQSPKITRHLTTEWFATRVDRRWRDCVARASAGSSPP